MSWSSFWLNWTSSSNKDQQLPLPLGGVEVNWVDILIVCIVGFTVFRSLGRGLIREVFEVLGLVGAIFLAYEYYTDTGAYLVMTTGMPPGLANGAAFILIAAGAAVAAGILGFIMGKAIQFTPIGIVDRLGGLGMGLAKGFLFTCILVVFMASVPMSFAYTSLEHSYLARRVIVVLPRVYGELEALFPDNFPRWEIPKTDKSRRSL